MDTRYYPMINRALKFLKLKESISAISTEDKGSSFSKFITISREPGSGGAPIAKAVADKLGFEFVDNQIVDEIAKSTNKRKEIIKAVDEKARTTIEDIVHAVLNKEYIDDYKYTKELFKVILTYAYKGKTVILGRGSNFVTPFARGLHVNITAPYRVRVQRAIDFEGHSREKAKEIIAKIEKERKDFVKQYLRQDIKKANSYDLTINTTYFKVDDVRDIIIESFNKKFS